MHIAIPAMDELDFLPHLIADIQNQETSFLYKIYICVNQPDVWWNCTDDNAENAEKRKICENNAETLKYLHQLDNGQIQIIDRSSLGKGWVGDKYGVGWARKVLFDSIMQIADDEDVIISLDADTSINPLYFESVGNNFLNHKISVLSLPYYHNLTMDENANRAILRYEIYMRCYLINMFRIDSPYAFTAIGSAIALKVNSLRKIGGITPAKSGEDFYLLQKMRKMTTIANYNTEPVYPAARFSTRVFFGTGPAMIKGNTGNWDSFPFYHYSLFDEIKNTYDIVNRLFVENVETDFVMFLQRQYNEPDLWQPLRDNAKNLTRFERAFHEKADALRILQYLKYTNSQRKIPDNQALYENLQLFFHDEVPDFIQPDTMLEKLSVEQLQIVRNQLFIRENNERKIQFKKIYL